MHCGSCCSRAKCSRSSTCEKCHDSGRGPATTTSTGPPKPTSARSRGFRCQFQRTARLRIRLVAVRALRHKVLDDADAEVAPGTEGLLYIAGPSIFLGYWNRPEQNARVFHERDRRRWYNTGDVVRLDPTMDTFTSAAAIAWSSVAATGLSLAR